MSPENHDAAFAAVSHLPHLLAFAYFSSVVRQPGGREFLDLAGPGFRDFTRIAASDPVLWRDVLVSNREEIIKQSARFRHTLDALEHMMRSANSEALEEIIRHASQLRAEWQRTNLESRCVRNSRMPARGPSLGMKHLDIPPLA